MNNINNINTALSIASKAHYNQIDKGGAPYILHPIRVMMKMDNNNERIIALLHDVVEDSDITNDELTNDFTFEITQSIELLTRRGSYSQYFEKLLNDPVAMKVKKADLEDNMNILRLKNLNQNDLRRLERYHEHYQLILAKERV